MTNSVLISALPVVPMVLIYATMYILAVVMENTGLYWPIE